MTSLIDFDRDSESGAYRFYKVTKSGVAQSRGTGARILAQRPCTVD